MNRLRCCLVMFAMMAVFVVPAAAYAEETIPDSVATFATGDIIESYGNTDPVDAGEAVYFKITGCHNDTLVDLIDSVTFDCALGFKNDDGEFQELACPCVFTYETPVYDDPEYDAELQSRCLRRYSTIHDEENVYLKVTNISSEQSSFRACVTTINQYGDDDTQELPLGKKLGGELPVVSSAVYNYTPTLDKERNIFLDVENKDSKCLDYFLVKYTNYGHREVCLIQNDEEEGTYYFTCSASDEGYGGLQETLKLDDLSTVYPDDESAHYEFYATPSLMTPPREKPDMYEEEYWFTPTNLKYYTISQPGTCTYSGFSKRPAITVKYGSIKLVRGSDYGVKYTNNKNAGKATVKITGYSRDGVATKYFTIKKAKNPMTVTAKTKKVFAPSRVKKSSVSFKAITVKNKRTAVTYTVKYANSKSKKALSFNKKTGKITVNKGTKAGNYKVTITVSSGNKNYCKKTIKKTIRVGVYVVL